MKKPGTVPPIPGVVTPPEMHPADQARPGAPVRDDEVCRHCRGTGLMARARIATAPG
jgi:hypothetical protein